jgi:CubicO group peptidase (beta-lactamase class C family)
MPTETDPATFSALDRTITHGPGAIAAAKATDPARMGWMQGSPLPDDRLVRLVDGSAWSFPRLRWSLSNFARLTPMAEAGRGSMPVRPFPVALRDDIDAVTFTPLANSGFDGPIRFDEALHANFTDAIVVVHKGVIVYERHFGVTGPNTRHLLFSVSKSFAGTIAAMLVADGRLDENALVGALVPELAGSGFGDATLRQVMDMTTGLAYSEDYTSPTADIARLVAAIGLAPNQPAVAAAGLRAYLPTIAKAGAHGDVFGYRTCNTEVLGWILHRTTGQSLTDLVGAMLWSKLGMEQSALFVIDGHGSEFAGGGMNAALRDLARFGEMMRLGGSVDGVEIVPRGVVDDIRRGGDPARFAPAGYETLPGWSYRNQWWVSHDAHGCYTARGVRGQMIWIDPLAEMTIVRFGSHPLAANGQFDPTSLPGWTAVAKHLMAG